MWPRRLSELQPSSDEASKIGFPTDLTSSGSCSTESAANCKWREFRASSSWVFGSWEANGVNSVHPAAGYSAAGKQVTTS